MAETIIEICQQVLRYILWKVQNQHENPWFSELRIWSVTWLVFKS